MSGHNKWSTIKHKKGAADAKRGKIFTKIIKEITVAARMGGGDITGNPRLRRAVDLAKANNMPADNVTRAIKKGTGELEGVNYEELVYEGVGPAGTLFMCEVVTDNRNRIAAELRKIFDKHSGSLGASGSAAWAFDAKGFITLPKSAGNEEQVMELAITAGAEDVQDGGEQWLLVTDPVELDAVRTALAEAGTEAENVELSQVAKTPKTLDGGEAETAMSLVESLEDNDDVQKVHSDFELSEEALAKLSES